VIMKLVDELRLAGISGALLERAEIIEQAYIKRGEQLHDANLPVKEPMCGVTLTANGWYEWRIKGQKCTYGYVTWREAHEAGCTALRTVERDKWIGRVRGGVLHLKGLIKALESSDGCGGIIFQLRRIARFLEERQ